MLIGVVTTGSPAMGYTAKVPDLPTCVATDPDMERVLTRIHLVLEGFFSDRLRG
jgi:predicted RNase H-like HicB family nuclease